MRASWPVAIELADPTGADSDPAIYAVAAAVLSAVRKKKALAKVSLKTPVDSVTVHDTQDRLRLLSRATADLREAGNIRAVDQAEADVRGRDGARAALARHRGSRRTEPPDGLRGSAPALEERKETRMVPDLSRILAIATYLDDPQLSYPTIHVTGTNGKGTAARVATEITCAHGLTTGCTRRRTSSQ